MGRRVCAKICDEESYILWESPSAWSRQVVGLLLLALLVSAGEGWLSLGWNVWSYRFFNSDGAFVAIYLDGGLWNRPRDNCPEWQFTYFVFQCLHLEWSISCVS